MSRAFVKGDGDEHGDELPERPVPPGPNYVTPAGRAQLVRRVAELEDERRRLIAGDASVSKARRQLERDLRYFEARLQTAVVVDPSRQEPGVARFGSVVEVEEEGGERRRFQIVGQDEADAGAGTVSWSSPLAAAVLGAKPGDTVEWSRPEGAARLRVTSIEPPPAV